MAKKRKSKPARKPCGCAKMTLGVGPVLIRCARHRGKPSKGGRVLCYWDEGYVRQEDES